MLNIMPEFAILMMSNALPCASHFVGRFFTFTFELDASLLQDVIQEKS